MGGNTFFTTAEGRTADDAFRTAVSQAQWEYGHGGYTGTIAEKASDGFVMIADNGSQVSERIRAEKKRLQAAIRRTTDKFEKNSLRWRLTDLRTIKLKKRMSPREIASALMDLRDRRVDDKWGPCGCIDLTPNLTGKRKPKRFLFFGWASS
jgi:hypothetical protein